MNNLTATVSLIMLLFGIFLLIITVQKGKKVVNYLKQRYPKKWEEAGKPKTGYFPDVRRQYWSRFIMQRKYLEYNDPDLEEMGESQRFLEVITLGYIIGYVLVFGVIAVWDKFWG